MQEPPLLYDEKLPTLGFLAYSDSKASFVALADTMAGSIPTWSACPVHNRRRALLSPRRLLGNTAAIGSLVLQRSPHSVCNGHKRRCPGGKRTPFTSPHVETARGNHSCRHAHNPLQHDGVHGIRVLLGPHYRCNRRSTEIPRRCGDGAYN
ncbi:hypothetical protein LX36DRAFT_407829 [Colletotrichum falcatum]|nr:hypothetical protein LX36DRAFT_407829 [Colletotrichum falcatum]